MIEPFNLVWLPLKLPSVGEPCGALRPHDITATVLTPETQLWVGSWQVAYLLACALTQTDKTESGRRLTSVPFLPYNLSQSLSILSPSDTYFQINCKPCLSISNTFLDSKLFIPKLSTRWLIQGALWWRCFHGCVFSYSCLGALHSSKGRTRFLLLKQKDFQGMSTKSIEFTARVYQIPKEWIVPRCVRRLLLVCTLCLYMQWGPSLPTIIRHSAYTKKTKLPLQDRENLRRKILEMNLGLGPELKTWRGN